jgi:hypothetical protein
LALINLFRPCIVSLHCKGKTSAHALKQLPLRSLCQFSEFTLHEANFYRRERLEAGMRKTRESWCRKNHLDNDPALL